MHFNLMRVHRTNALAVSNISVVYIFSGNILKWAVIKPILVQSPINQYVETLSVCAHSMKAATVDFMLNMRHWSLAQTHNKKQSDAQSSSPQHISAKKLQPNVCSCAQFNEWYCVSKMKTLNETGFGFVTIMLLFILHRAVALTSR